MLACLIGLYLGYLTERSGSIRPALLCHAVNNTMIPFLKHDGRLFRGKKVEVRSSGGDFFELQ